MPRYDDYDARGAGRDIPFPAEVMAAGIIWIVFGVLGIGSSALSLLIDVGTAANAGQGQAPSGRFGGGCGLLFAIAFLVVGIQTVKGTAKGTLANGIGSHVFGLLYAGLGVLLIVLATLPQTQLPVELFYVLGALCGLLGIALLVAGLLAVAGKQAYEDWRRDHGLDRPPRRIAADDDYDDRPRRRPRDDYED
jgi:hypothetical protein